MCTVPIKLLFSPLGKRAYRTLKTWSHNWCKDLGEKVEAAQEKAAKAKADKLKRQARGKNRGANSNVGKGKVSGKKVNGDFIDDLIDIRKQYFPIDPEVYQAMAPFIDDDTEIIPDVPNVPEGGEGVAAPLDSDDFDIGDMASSQASLDSVAPQPPASTTTPPLSHPSHAPSPSLSSSPIPTPSPSPTPSPPPFGTPGSLTI